MPRRWRAIFPKPETERPSSARRTHAAAALCLRSRTTECGTFLWRRRIGCGPRQTGSQEAKTVGRESQAGDAFANRHKAALIGERQRAEKCGINHGEDRGVDTDAEG